ncbi:MAG: hypothetical protein KGL11_05340 [Alphaproteobacteria bacterium]|nr:hypothetical protein [Alphaproteobacteria bacterium]
MSRRLAARLKEALAELCEPWVILANRRRSGADGPPWVRYIALHPGKGIALVDVDPTEPAVAPLDEFLWHTGFAALQAGALPIVALTIPAAEIGIVAERLDAAFSGSPCRITNPNWCEAVVDLLLSTPELMLIELRREAAVAPPPEPLLDEPSAVPEPSPAAAMATLRRPAMTAEPTLPLPADDPIVTERGFEPPAMRRPALPANDRRSVELPPAPRRAIWRSWPNSRVAVAAGLVALAAVTVFSRQVARDNRLTGPLPVGVMASASPPTEIAPAAETVAPAPQPPTTIAPTSETVASAPQLPASDASAASPAPSQSSAAAPPIKGPQAAASPAGAAKPKVTARKPTAHYARTSPQREQRMASAGVAPSEQQTAWAGVAPSEQHIASANAAPRAVCADVLHPNLPGGWQYRGPPVSGCLPIRFFGFIGMR